MTPRPRRGQQCPKSLRPGAHEVGGRGGPRSVWMEWWAGQERHWGRGGGGWGERLPGAAKVRFWPSLCFLRDEGDGRVLCF